MPVDDNNHGRTQRRCRNRPSYPPIHRPILGGLIQWTVMQVWKPSPLPDAPKKGRMVVISDGDFRPAPLTEHRLLSNPMSVSAGSKHDNITNVLHKGSQIYCHGIASASQIEHRSPYSTSRRELSAYLCQAFYSVLFHS